MLAWVEQGPGLLTAAIDPTSSPSDEPSTRRVRARRLPLREARSFVSVRYRPLADFDRHRSMGIDPVPVDAPDVNPIVAVPRRSVNWRGGWPVRARAGFVGCTHSVPREYPELRATGRYSAPLDGTGRTAVRSVFPGRKTFPLSAPGQNRTAAHGLGNRRSIH